MRPYRRLVIATVLLTLVGSLAAQVNPHDMRLLRGIITEYHLEMPNKQLLLAL